MRLLLLIEAVGGEKFIARVEDDFLAGRINEDIPKARADGTIALIDEVIFYRRREADSKFEDVAMAIGFVGRHVGCRSYYGCQSENTTQPLRVG